MKTANWHSSEYPVRLRRGRLLNVGIHKANETKGVFDSNPDYSEKSVNAIRKIYDEVIK
jgi:predicted transcriptional regulator